MALGVHWGVSKSIYKYIQSADRQLIDSLADFWVHFSMVTIFLDRSSDFFFVLATFCRCLSRAIIPSAGHGLRGQIDEICLNLRREKNTVIFVKPVFEKDYRKIPYTLGLSAY